MRARGAAAVERIAAAVDLVLSLGWELITRDFGVDRGDDGQSPAWISSRGGGRRACCALGAVLVAEQPSPAGDGTCSESVIEALGVSSDWAWGFMAGFDGRPVSTRKLVEEEDFRIGYAAGADFRARVLSAGVRS